MKLKQTGQYEDMVYRTTDHYGDMLCQHVDTMKCKFLICFTKSCVVCDDVYV